MPDFQSARRAMVDSQLRPEGVTNPAVLAAMASVPREKHVPELARAFAYFDRSIALGDGRVMMPPAALGKLLDALDPQPGMRALVVAGAGGYAAALLSKIGLDVTESETGDGARGAFDRILVDGAIERLPDSLTAALAPGGRVATALIDRGVTRLAVGTRAGAWVAFRTIADADVAPLPGFATPRAFTF